MGLAYNLGDQVVEALRICYIDFKPLRVAGDLIFKVINLTLALTLALALTLTLTLTLTS